MVDKSSTVHRKRSSRKKNESGAHDSEKPKSKKQVRKSNEAAIKAVFIILGVALLVAAYYIGFLVGSASITSDGGSVPSDEKGADNQVVITEFSDFQCPFCKRFFTQTYNKLKETYGDKIRFEFKNFPLGFHPYAQKAAEAAECARDQGKFWEMHDKIFENSPNIDVPILKKLAEELGLDTEKFNACLDNGDKADKVKSDSQEAVEKGVKGTPSFWINGELVVGAQPFEVFKQKIDAALNGEKPAPKPAPKPENNQPQKVEGVSADDDSVMGSDDAPVTIVEFSDYQCPYCKRSYEQSEPQIIKNFVDTGKAKLIFRDFPLGFHPHAQKAAEAAECAGEQGKYWEMHDKLYDNQQSLGVDNYKKWAEEMGLDTEKFSSCLDNGDMADEVKKDFEDGRKYGVSGTPTYFINGLKIVGAQPYSVFESAINDALKA